MRKKNKNTRHSAHKKLTIKGDTIVEVLMAILVASLVIAGAFSSARSSLTSNRDSQERNEAIKLAQGQIELLSYLAGQNNDDIFNSSTGLFCIRQSDQSLVNFGASTLPALDSDNFSIYPSECRNQNSRYNVSVKYDSGDNLFTTTVRWARFGEAINQEAIIRYRLYQANL